MDEHTPTVAVFFGLQPDGGGVPEEMALAVAKATKSAVQSAATNAAILKTVLKRGIPSTQWAAAGTQVISSLHQELADLSLPSLFVKGWSTYGRFREYCKEAKYPSQNKYVVPLFKHSLTSKHHPVIELRLDGVPAGKVSFDVELSVNFDDVAVVIQNKKFMAVQTGSATGKGALKCEGVQVLERTLGTLSLPGHISFGDGYSI